MHCLFPGVAKHFLKVVLIGQDIYIISNDLLIIKIRVNAMCVPSDMDVYLIELNMHFILLQQTSTKTGLCNTRLHSYMVITSEHLECWQHFLLACRYMCKPVLTQNSIRIGDALLLKFCSREGVIMRKQRRRGEGGRNRESKGRK